MKKVFFVILMLILSGSMALALEQEKRAGSVMTDWLRSLQQKIAQLAPKKSMPMNTSVAGVRGARENSQAKLYWKGKKGDEAVSEEELTEFKEGLEAIEKGDGPKAIHELEEFMKLYPDSALIPDVKKTLDLVKAEPPKPEEKKEEKK